MAAMAKPAPKPKKPVAFVLSPADDDILRAVFRYHYLTINQVARLLGKSRTTVAARLKRLTDAGYLHAITVPTRQGNGPNVYALANNGLQFLGDAGLPVPKRTRLSTERQYSYLFFSHTLAVNDFLMDVELFTARHPDVTIERLYHDRDLKRMPVQVDDGAGGKAVVIPDGYVDLLFSNTYQACWALELDRGTEDQRTWRKKVRLLVAYAAGPYVQAFGTGALTICVVTTAPSERLRQLYQWTEEELSEANLTNHADLFYFAGYTPGTILDDRVFLVPGWRVPFQQHAVALVDPSLIGNTQTNPNGSL